MFLALVFSIATISSAIAQRQVLSGHIPQLVKDLNLQPMSRLAATNILHLAIGLPLRDPAGARTFVQQLYDPSSPLYHQYLTTEQFTEKFGPSADDYQAVIDFAKASGFVVTRTDPHRLLVDVDARAADVENAFRVRMFEYQHPTEVRRFYAPDAEPSVPSGIHVLDVSGISNYPRPHPNYHVANPAFPSATPIPNGGSIPGGQYIGNDFRVAYIPGSPLTGIGQNIALVQFDGYYPSDITRYETLAGLPAIALTNILLDGFSGVPTTGTLSGNGEVSLDIEMVNSMAPGITKLFLYEGNPNNFIPNDVLQQIYNDDNSRQISCSWGWSGGPTDTTDNIFIEMASHGQSFFVASGDSDAYPGSTADSPSGFGTPAVSAYVISVGGTMLSTLGPTNSWSGESVWNWGVELGSSENGVGSSGGYSVYYSIPTWQQGVNPANLASTTGRNFPDVAMIGDHVLVAYGNGTTNWFGGTSCASPLWAAFTALVNQQGALNGKAPVGFLNPAIYTIGTGTTYTTCFHDITTGNNEWSNSPSAYTATTGYDLCTGWGSPNGTNLINALVGPPTNLPNLIVSSTVISGGNGNGVIDADECNLLNLYIQNVGGGTATTVNATLTTSTPGVTITQPTASYPNIAPGFVATNTAPFQISTSPSFVCGTEVSLSLISTYAGGSTTNVLSLPSCQCPSLEPTGGLSASSPKQTGRLTRNGTASSCAAAKSCPGDFSTSGSYAYNAFSFTNTSPSSVCVTVTVSTACSGSGSTAIFSETYLGSFIPTSLCTGYLADLGGSPSGSGAYSFDVPANTNFTVVVNAVNVGSYCSSFTLTVAGLPCFVDGGGACEGISASFSGTPTNGSAPLAVTFTDTSTGSITNHFWNFGDGGTTNLTTNTVVYAYNTAGVYTVSEIVTGPGGSSTNTRPNYIAVSTSSLVASFTAAPTNGIAPLSVTFTDTSTGLITNWSWNFGDGGTTNLTTNAIVYTYNTAGVYTVTEIVTGPGGSSTNTQSNYITVSAPPPVASFTAAPTNGIAPLSVAFTDTSTGLITNHFWSFGDGGTINLTTNAVVYAYNTAGVYTVTEIVTGPGGSSTNTRPNYIVVLTPFQGWQIQYFGSTNNPNAAMGADPDGTGQDNLFKFVAGLDPTNPASIFLLTIMSDTNQPNAQDLQFMPMVGGRTYTPQFNTDLVNGVWSPLATYTGPVTNGNQISVTDTNPLPPQEFYRINISLP